MFPKGDPTHKSNSRHSLNTVRDKLCSCDEMQVCMKSGKHMFGIKMGRIVVNFMQPFEIKQELWHRRCICTDFSLFL